MEDNTVMNEIEEIQTMDEDVTAQEESGNFGAFIAGIAGGTAAYLIIKEAKRAVNWAIGKWGKHKQKKAAAATIVDAEIVEDQTAESDEKSQDN